MKKIFVGLVAALTVVQPIAAGAEPLQAGNGLSDGPLAGCATDLRYLNHLFGWQATWPVEWDMLKGASDAEIRQALDRWKAAPALLRKDQQSLARPGRPGAAPRIVAERVLAQLDGLSAKLRTGAPSLRADTAADLKAEWQTLFATGIGPAIDDYRAYLRNDYVPRASASAGLVGTPDNVRCYKQAAKYFTTLDLAPEEIEKTGWRLMGEAHAELAKLHKIDVSKVPALLASFRDYKGDGITADRLLAKIDKAIDRANAAMPRMFSRPSKRKVAVERVPAELQETAIAAHYRPAEGNVPAAVFVNLHRPQDRWLMAEVLAFHEALPGHDVVDALGYTRGAFNSGFGEGWAIYAEYLADELGLYSTDLDRSAMMAKHAWAASRLIVEPGLHLHGWTRQKAIDFMRTHTALSEQEIAVEVDRYISTPGQSLAYMLGYERIAAARRNAEAALGPRFDIREFHDVVLGKGGRPLQVMEADVRAWVERKKAA